MNYLVDMAVHKDGRLTDKHEATLDLVDDGPPTHEDGGTIQKLTGAFTITGPTPQPPVPVTGEERTLGKSVWYLAGANDVAKVTLSLQVFYPYSSPVGSIVTTDLASGQATTYTAMTRPA